MDPPTPRISTRSPRPAPSSVDSANPVTVGGVIYPLANPLASPLPSPRPAVWAGLGLDQHHARLVWLRRQRRQVRRERRGSVRRRRHQLRPAFSTASTNRALGLIATGGSGPAAVGVCLLNATGHTLNLLTLGFTAELWRQTAVAKVMTCSYYIDPTATNGFPTNANATGLLTNLTVSFPPLPAGSAEVAVDGTNPTNQQILVGRVSTDGGLAAWKRPSGWSGA